MLQSSLHEIMISIHALREEGDPCLWSPTPWQADFYPRPPRGGRRTSGVQGVRRSTFLSTPSARRATPFPCLRRSPPPYFYPRPPRGGRPCRSTRPDIFSTFLSTPSARRATRETGWRVYGLARFLSTPSARRATLTGKYAKLRDDLFLSTPSARRATRQQARCRA